VGRFFVWAGLFLSVFLPAQPARAGDKPEPRACPASHYDEKAVVKHVIDGDTVILADDRHVRLIGINAPEIGHDGRTAQPGADQAYNYLDSLLRTQKTINLHYDRQRLDRYNRTLAHLFLEDGTNVQALLLARGLATTLTIPPNIEFVECYEASATKAQIHRIGLWAFIQYQPTPAEFITRKDLGYRIITGKINRIVEGKSALWINLAKNLSLHIANEDLHYFSNLQGLAGKQIRAYGLLYFSNGEFRMQIRHPVDMKIIETTGGN
jgi:endonuclease YncB( thermonuclease family)